MQYSAEQLQRKFNFKLDDPTGNEPIDFAKESAADDLEEWLSPADFAFLDSSAELSAEDAKKQKRIIRAHAYLTVYYVFLNNTEIRASGAVGSEKGTDNESTVTYLKPKELEARREMYLNAAKNQIAKFAAVDFSYQIEPVDAPETLVFGSFSMNKNISW